MRKILIVDDERNIHYSFRRALEGEYEIQSAYDGDEALECLERERPDVMLLDVRMPKRGGISTLEHVRDRYPQLPVVVMTAFGTAEMAIRATSLAAREYLLKPVDVPSLRKLLAEILPDGVSAAEPTVDGEHGVDLVGQSPSVQELGKLIGRAASADATVLITGETGTGKELIARAIHRHGKRHRAPLVAVNCAAIPDNLLESELFGHERGAFTGADAMRPGKFELASGGTLLLDEIGDMPASLQAKLLRVLQTGEVTRLGGSVPHRFDVRVIAITNADLEARVARGTFREDLYYRLNVLRVQVPPLRERGEDVLLIARNVLERERARLDRAPLGFTRDAEQRLRAHAWPGNVRELENVIAQACLRARGEWISGEEIIIRSVASASERESDTLAPAETPDTLLERALDVAVDAFAGRMLEQVERAAVAKALQRTGGNQVQAARVLGTTRNVIRHRITKYSL
jgi:two-component system nitrogen regulation response regulator GlnG